MPSTARPHLPEGSERVVDALGNRVKLAVLRSLVLDGPATQTELAERVEVSRRLARDHLVALEALGIVSVTPPRSDPEPRQRYFAAEKAELERLLELLRDTLGLA